MIRVECHAGYRGEEEPRAFVQGDRRTGIVEVLDRWLGPDHRYFKVRGDDGAVYVLRHETTSGQWDLTLFRRRADAPDTAPDIVLLGVDWQPRALLRAQLIEEGLDVVAVDAWPALVGVLRPGSLPKLLIVDLQHLEGAEQILLGLAQLMRPGRVLVLTALGTMTPAELSRLGFRVAARPTSIQDIVAAARQALATGDSG